MGLYHGAVMGHFPADGRRRSAQASRYGPHTVTGAQPHQYLHPLFQAERPGPTFSLRFLAIATS